MAPDNKAAAGFHILVILSQVDQHFSDEESEIAARYISKHFKDEFRLEKETQLIRSLDPSGYFLHFKACMDIFYSKSSSHERAELVKFSVDMVKADQKITAEENVYLNELLNSWEPEHAG